jgi:hypothetical protein
VLRYVCINIFFKEKYNNTCSTAHERHLGRGEFCPMPAVFVPDSNFVKQD